APANERSGCPRRVRRAPQPVDSLGGLMLFAVGWFSLTEVAGSVCVSDWLATAAAVGARGTGWMTAAAAASIGAPPSPAVAAAPAAAAAPVALATPVAAAVRGTARVVVFC